jgi:arginase family enzyme
VRYFTMTDVHQQGLDEVMQLAYAHITQHSSHFGISIDLDSIDPRDAPGVSLPVPDGLRANELLTALKILQRQENFKRLIGLEIAEFHPASDMNQRTEQLIQDIIRAVMPQALRSQPIGSKE